MATRVSTGLTAAEGRRFGLTVGAAFLVLSGISWWRGHTVAPVVVGGLALLLISAGLAIPTKLTPVERGWMTLAHAISKVTTPIVMAIIYLVILTPVGLLRRNLGSNPLVHQAGAAGFWKTRPAGARRSPNLRRQF